jgi:NAD(P)-dependent dehydrogenase (short-subunit alcohol dehydrogenase family)
MHRVALVTGANRGIGHEVCKQLASAGLTVVLGSRDGGEGRRAAEQLRIEHGGSIRSAQLDVTDVQSIQRAVGTIEHELGRLDVLINNATAPMDREGGILDVPIDVVREMFEVNVYGPLMMCRACVPLMRRHRYGRIVNVSSSRGSFARLAADTPAYRMSKTTLNALTRVLSAELEGQGILVNAVAPGFVRTRLTAFQGTSSVEEGAQGIVRLATLPDDGPHGRFFKGDEVIAW